MIRGALLLGVGFGLGYAKAMHDSDSNFQTLKELAEGVQELLAELRKARTDREQEGKPDDGIGDISAEDMPRQNIDNSDAT